MSAERKIILLHMMVILMITIISHIGEGGFALYSRTLDCEGQTGCAFDQPARVRSRTGSKHRCALECLIWADCASFNYLERTESCLIFSTAPYKILNMSNCIGFDNQIKGAARGGENLSKYRRSCQSSTMIYNSKRLSSWLAVDDINETMVTKGNVGFCSHTDGGDSQNNWFMVDLVYSYKIRYARILARMITEIYIWPRYKNLTVGVTNNSWLVQTPIRNTYPLCGVYLGPPVNGTWIKIDCQLSIPPARFVIVHQVRLFSSVGGYMCLCEVQVY